MLIGGIVAWWRWLVAMVIAAMVGSLLPGVMVAQADMEASTEASEITYGAGLQGDDHWTGPLSGVEANWDASWQPTPLRTWADGETGEERLLLGWSEHPDGDLYIIVRPSGRGGAPHDVALWENETFLQDNYPVDNVEVLLSDPGTEQTNGAVLLGVSHGSLPYPVFHYKHSIPNDDGLGLYLLIEGPGFLFADAMRAAQDGFVLNGEPVTFPFSLEDIDAAMANYEAVPFSEEAAGFDGRQQYAGPVCDVAVAWNGSWDLNHDMTYPVVSHPLGGYDVAYLAADATGARMDVQAVISVPYDAGKLIDGRADASAVDLRWGEDAEAEVLLRTVGADRAEMLQSIWLPESDEVMIEWISFTWIEESGCNAYVEISALASDFESTWELWDDGVSVTYPGEPLVPMFTWEDLAAAINEN